MLKKIALAAAFVGMMSMAPMVGPMGDLTGDRIAHAKDRWMSTYRTGNTYIDDESIKWRNPHSFEVVVRNVDNHYPNSYWEEYLVVFNEYADGWRLNFQWKNSYHDMPVSDSNYGAILDYVLENEPYDGRNLKER